MFPRRGSACGYDIAVMGALKIDFLKFYISDVGNPQRKPTAKERASTCATQTGRTSTGQGADGHLEVKPKGIIPFQSGLCLGLWVSETALA